MKKSRCPIKGVKYIVRRPDNMKHIVIIENTCKLNKNKPECNTCYGKIILSREYVKDNREYKETVYRDKFSMIGSVKVVKDMAATNFYSELTSKYDIIPVTVDKSRITQPYYAADRSLTHKTDCLECKQRHTVPPCQDVDNNKKKGLMDHFCPTPKQRIVKFW